MKNDIKSVYATDALIIIKDKKETKFTCPFVAEVDELKLFVLAFEEIVYAKGNVSKTNVIVTDKEAAEKGDV